MIKNVYFLTSTESSYAVGLDLANQAAGLTPHVMDNGALIHFVTTPSLTDGRIFSYRAFCLFPFSIIYFLT